MEALHQKSPSRSDDQTLVDVIELRPMASAPQEIVCETMSLVPFQEAALAPAQSASSMVRSCALDSRLPASQRVPGASASLNRIAPRVARQRQVRRRRERAAQGLAQAVFDAE